MGKAKRAKQKRAEDNARLERQREEKRADRRDTMKVAAAAIAVLLVIAIIVTSICLIVSAVRGTGNYLRKRESVTSDNFTINNAMMTYFFRSALVSTISQVTSYYDTQTAMYYGLIPDTSRPLREQAYSNTGSTWYDQIMSSTTTSVTSMLVLAEGAHAAGITLTDADQYRIDEFIKTLKETAESEKMSLDKLLNENYGLGVKESDLRDALEIYYLSQLFYYKTLGDIEVTDKEISDYYDEHADEIDVVSYKSYTFSSTVEDASERADKLAETKSAKEFDASLRTLLDGIVANSNIDSTIENDLSENVTHVDDSEYSDWLFDEDTKVGDTKIIKSSSGSYTVYMLTEASHANKDETRNVRHILFSLSDYETEDECKAAAEEVYNKFISDKGDENAFAELAHRYSTDPGSSYFGGLYENVPKGQMVEEFEDWLFDDKREVGDCEIVKTSYGYHIMYYVGEGREAWAANVFSTLRNEKYTDIAKELTDKYKVNIDSKMLNNIPDVA